MKIKKVSVIGSGVMGRGIAQASAMAGFDVVLFDVDPALTDNALQLIDQNLSHAVSKGKLTESAKQQTLKRLNKASAHDEVKGDLIIEAIVEKLQPKQQLLAKLQENNPGSILATNTSTFPITQVAATLRDPSRCVGLHFFNPANVMKLVEVISGASTSPEVLEAAIGYVTALEKIPVQANDSPGFIVNRVARSFYLESLRLLEENGASKEAIDSLVRGTGFRMGPFELMDLIGLDTNLAVTESLYEAFGGPEKFKPNSIQVAMVKDKRFGVKTGKGFYEYPR